MTREEIGLEGDRQRPFSTATSWPIPVNFLERGTNLMMTKKEVLEAALRGEGALGKAADDEPVFVLRAQDCLAADLVDKWAIFARVGMPSAGVEASGHKINEAVQIADAMRNWPKHKQPD
jgi:hypothetical protein